VCCEPANTTDPVQGALKATFARDIAGQVTCTLKTTGKETGVEATIEGKPRGRWSRLGGDGCFWVIEAHGSRRNIDSDLRVLIVVRSRSKCQRQRPDPAVGAR